MPMSNDNSNTMTSWVAVQGVDSSLYVYQEVLEGCNELVTAEEYTGLGQVHKSLNLKSINSLLECVHARPFTSRMGALEPHSRPAMLPWPSTPLCPAPRLRRALHDGGYMRTSFKHLSRILLLFAGHRVSVGAAHE